MYINILRDLVAYKSISPFDDGAIDYCADFLSLLGFKVNKYTFGETKNLYARFGNARRNLCFAGHIDVVPPLGKWSVDPFSLTIKEDAAYGRGTNDMKGPLSCCLAAIHSFVKTGQLTNNMGISIILTSDEEIMGGDGTKKIVERLIARKERIDHCVLCESSSILRSGEYIKVGSRGSMNVDLIARGRQLHVANTDKGRNCVHELIEMLDNFISVSLDFGNERFPSSSIQVTSIDVGNEVRNIVPESAVAKLNIRFNDCWDIEKLKQHVIDSFNGIDVSFETFGEAYVSSDDSFVLFIANSINKSSGLKPKSGTYGGNSDSLFLKELANVVEVGSPVENAHIVDEYIRLDDLEVLYKIYKGIIHDYNNLCNLPMTR